MLTLNVGCGDRAFDEYPKGYKCINYDIRSNLKKVDVVGDVRVLPFSDEHFDYILASDILEHFPLSETKKVLTEWIRVLKKEGIIEIRVPNLKTICNNYLQGVNDAKHTSWLLYGGQNYSGNFHYICFDRDFLKTVVIEVGFKEIYHTDEGNNFVTKFKKVLV